MTWQWNVLGVVPIAAALVSTWVAWIVYTTRPRRRQNRAAALMVFLLGLQIGAMALRLLRADAQGAFALYMVYLWAVTLYVPVVVAFVTTVPGRLPRALQRFHAVPVMATVASVAGTAALVGPGFTGGVRYSPAAGIWVGDDFLWPWRLMVVAFLVSTLGGLAALVSSVREARTTRDRNTLRILALSFGATVVPQVALAVAATTFAVQNSPVGATGTFVNFYLYPPGVLIGVVLLAYAILRHQVLDIDVRVKWTITQSTVAGAFVAVFFIVSELAAALFSERLGQVAGIVSAGLLLFAIAPLQDIAHRVADRAMPGVKPVARLDENEKRDVYAAAARQAWNDGLLDASERAMLDGMRAHLGLDAEVAARIESEAAARGA